jgi:hypothetical protein
MRPKYTRQNVKNILKGYAFYSTNKDYFEERFSNFHFDLFFKDAIYDVVAVDENKKLCNQIASVSADKLNKDTGTFEDFLIVMGESMIAFQIWADHPEEKDALKNQQTAAEMIIGAQTRLAIFLDKKSEKEITSATKRIFKMMSMLQRDCLQDLANHMAKKTGQECTMIHPLHGVIESN